jgi:predicted RNase H-like HicB family nuclease
MTTFFEKIFRTIFPHEDPAQVKHEYKLPESINFSLRVTPDGWFVVTMPDHPGLVTQANSHKGLMEMVNDAVLTYYDVPKRKADIIYDRLDVGATVIQYQGQLQTKHA